MTLRVAARGVQAAPVRSLHFLAGSSSGGSGGSGSGQGWNGEDSLLVFGGQVGRGPSQLVCWVSNAVQGCTEPRVALFGIQRPSLPTVQCRVRRTQTC